MGQDVTIDIPSLSLSDSSESLQDKLDSTVDMRSKVSTLLLSFNFVTDDTVRSVQNYQEEMSVIVEWQKLLQHYEPQINCAVKFLQGFKIILKNELETDEAIIRTDSKLSNSLNAGQMTQVVRSRTANDRKKMAILGNHLSMWEAILDNYLKKARNLQTQYSNIEKMLRVMEKTGELDVDPYKIVGDCSDNLDKRISDLEEKCLPGINNTDLVSDNSNYSRGPKDPEEASPTGEKSLEDLFEDLEN
jgi:hypothetical protein